MTPEREAEIREMLSPDYTRHDEADYLAVVGELK